MTGPVLTDEQLAALLDGRLREPERAERLSTLAASDEDYEVFAETAALLRDLEAAGITPPAVPAADPLLARDADPIAPGDADPPATGEVDPPASARDNSTAAPGDVLSLDDRRASRGRRRWSPARWGAIAAAVAAVALIPLVWSRQGTADYGDPVRLAAALESPEQGLPEGWLDRRPWGTRGNDDGLSDEALAARLGALLVDLELAVHAGDTATASRLAGRVEAMLDDMDGAGPIADVYGDVQARAHSSPEELAGLLAQGRTAVRGLPDGEFVRLGAWTEAARIAASRRDADFFRSRESRAALARMAETASLPAPAREAVERVRAAVEAGGAPEWATLEVDLHALLRALAR